MTKNRIAEHLNDLVGKRRNDCKEVQEILDRWERIKQELIQGMFGEGIYGKNPYAGSFYLVPKSFHWIFDINTAACVASLTNLAYLAWQRNAIRFLSEENGKPVFDTSGIPCFPCSQSQLMNELCITVDQEEYLVKKLTNTKLTVKITGVRQTARVCYTFRKNIKGGDRPIRFIFIDVPLIQYKIQQEEKRRRRRKPK